MEMTDKHDNSLLAHITKLNGKEEHLYGKEKLTDAEVYELHHIKSEVDQY